MDFLISAAKLQELSQTKLQLRFYYILTIPFAKESSKLEQFGHFYNSCTEKGCLFSQLGLQLASNVQRIN